MRNRYPGSERSQAWPFLSIVVPTHNRASLLNDCVESLMVQDFPPDRYEIIVVDDWSTDQTSAIIAGLQSRAGRRDLKYVHSDGRGLNAARNCGLRVAKGDPILFVDDDVLAPETWLRANAEGILRHPESGCLGGPVRLRLEGKPPRFCGRDGLGESELDLGEIERGVDFVMGANFCVRRGAVDKVGPFNESLPIYGDETEWEMRLVRGGGQIVYLPKAWLWHRRTATDLKLLRMLGAQFRRGIANVLFARAIGERMTIASELIPVPRLLAHAVRRRCAGGLLSISRRVGRSWALVREQVRDFWRAVTIGQPRPS